MSDDTAPMRLGASTDTSPRGVNPSPQSSEGHGSTLSAAVDDMMKLDATGGESFLFNPQKVRRLADWQGT